MQNRHGGNWQIAKHGFLAPWNDIIMRWNSWPSISINCIHQTKSGPKRMSFSSRKSNDKIWDLV